MLTPEYIAGFFDGDGSVTLVVRNKRVQYRSDRKGNKRAYRYTNMRGYQYEIKIVQKNRKVLDQIKQTLGYGRVSTTNMMYKSRSGNRPYQIHTYRVQGGPNLLKFITKVGLHTVVKKEQLDIMLEFLNTLTKGGKKIPEDVHNYREQLCVACKDARARSHAFNCN